MSRQVVEGRYWYKWALNTADERGVQKVAGYVDSRLTQGVLIDCLRHRVLVLLVQVWNDECWVVSETFRHYTISLTFSHQPSAKVDTVRQLRMQEAQSDRRSIARLTQLFPSDHVPPDDVFAPLPFFQQRRRPALRLSRDLAISFAFAQKTCADLPNTDQKGRLPSFRQIR